MTLTPHTGEYLLRKVSAYGRLREESADPLRAIGSSRQHDLPARQDIISEGEDPREVHLLIEGWACRYKVLEDGRRQILAYFLPGDLFDLYVYILDEMDHSIATVTRARVAKISSRELEEMGDAHPQIIRALWWDTLVAASIQREWTVNLGQRSAFESLCHLCCELYLRMRQIGLVEKGGCAFPLTQQDLADSLGLTVTHTARMIRQLNQSGLAVIAKRSLTVLDLRGLKTAGCFVANYLHQRDPE